MRPTPIDPDIAVDPPVPSQAKILLAIALGGALGSCARYGATLIWPGSLWTTFWVNVTGCAAMGVLMVLITERYSVHPLVRPFLGTGILGGYTTFSTYAVDAQHLIAQHRACAAVTYLAVTLVSAVLAVWAAAALTRRCVR
ncbi:CrcB family protein [Pseudonocardiaceae bacterium YIM PH 21723]|nr:CrcB family protein [Pseudonocardiaceae bacterium YIM PH 21723]